IFLPQPSASGREASGLREAAALPADSDPRRASGELAIVSGVARADGTSARLSPLYRVTSGAPTEASDPAGQHCLSFEGGGNSPAEHCFDISFQNHETWEQLDEAGFSVLVPWDSETSRVTLHRGGQPLSSLSTSANPPQVAFTAPGQGEQWLGGESKTVVWSGSDSDGDSLTYTLMYSHDGGVNWLPLAMDITTASYTLDTAQIRGGSNVFFRVLASDGFRVTTATSAP
ncbi:MAG: hypothetical protein GY953_17730, partial [bacterium]|nr:hypothetical protein [bacterium]